MKKKSMLLGSILLLSSASAFCGEADGGKLVCHTNGDITICAITLNGLDPLALEDVSLNLATDSEANEAVQLQSQE